MENRPLHSSHTEKWGGGGSSVVILELYRELKSNLKGMAFIQLSVTWKVQVRKIESRISISYIAYPWRIVKVVGYSLSDLILKVLSQNVE